MSDVTFSTAVNAYRRANNGESVRNMESSGGLSTPTMPGESTAQSNQPNFAQLVGEGLRRSAATGYASEEVSTRAIANEADLHELVTSVANAELTLNTVVAVRDRMVSAYQEIIKMPI